jgi:hypothetical protein
METRTTSGGLSEDSDLPQDIRVWTKYDYPRAQNHLRMSKMTDCERLALLCGMRGVDGMVVGKVVERPTDSG